MAGACRAVGILGRVEIVKTGTTAEFLGLVPALAGRRPERSIVFIPFAGKRTLPGVCRLDLPARERRSDIRAAVHAALGILARIRPADRVDVVVYTDRTFADERGIPHLELGRAAVEGLERAGFHVGLAACVAADGWGDYLDRTHQEAGCPLDEITAPALSPSLEAQLDASAVEFSTHIPDADAEARRQVARILGFEDAPDVELAAFARDLPTLDLFDFALDGGDEPVMIAIALALFESPAMRDAALLRYAFGREVGERAVLSNAYWAAVVERTGQTMDEVVDEEIAAGDFHDDCGDRLMGRTDAVPDRERLGRVIRRMRTLVAHAPDEMRAAPLTMLAWALWACGSGSAAGAALDRAVAVDPEYRMAALLRTWIGVGALPDWLFSRLG